LDDYFKVQDRNVDYLNIDESDFSSDYKYYENDWYKWFSDFLTIWNDYSDWWFRPRAVAMHISYMNNDTIMIKHFVSDSNWDLSNVAWKFEEANEKLINWYTTSNIPNTKALDIFKELHESQHFPWLWVLKKLSIMNHIELVINNI
jgi:hypothetical protein